MKINFFLFFCIFFLSSNVQSYEISKVVIQNKNSSSISITAEVMTTESQQAKGMNEGLPFLRNMARQYGLITG